MIGKGNQNFWSEEEDAILRSTYPTNGMEACMKLLPNRTKNAIQTRLRNIGVHLRDDLFREIRAEAARKATAAVSKWDEQYDATLRRVYVRHGIVGACRALPNFNKIAIKNRAFQLGLRVSRGQFGEMEQMPEDWEDQPPIKLVVPVGEWKVEAVPPIRSVFDLAEVV